MRNAICGRAFAALMVLVAATMASAAQPRFTQPIPHGVQRGTEVELTLHGSNLEDAEELLLYDPGMEVISFSHPEDERQKGRQIKVQLKVAEDCPLGSQRMRIRTRTGISDLQNLYVGPLPIIEEKEPNTDFEAPQPIEKNVTVHGRIDREDVDYFVIEAKKGERISAEVYGMRLGLTGGANYFDPYLAILDEERFEIAVSDDTPLVWNDAVVSVIAPEDGKYIIQLRDAAYNGDGRAYYLLSVGDFPRPQGVIPSGGRPGETLTVTLVGDPKGLITQEVTLPVEVPERFGIEVRDEAGVAPSVQPFRVSDLANVVEQEPNNDRTQATPMEKPGAANGVLGEPGDVDYFKFSAKKDEQVDIEVYARRIRSPLDPVLNVYRADNGSRIGGNDDSRGPDSYLRFKAPEDGEYVLSVSDHLKNGGPLYTYRVELTPITPSVRGEPIEIARYVQPNFVVPQGGGAGVVVNVQRQDFGGPVSFKCDDLPEGVRIECPENWRGGGQVSLAFFADESAPLAGKHCTVKVYLADPNQADRKIEGPLLQNLLMIRGRNNNRVWEEEILRIPIVVSEKAPFKAWIEAPAVPLVQGGSMDLVVKCEKAEGWDEEISLRLLQTPPGVNASISAKIPKGQTEAVIPMNAAANAAVQESMIAVRCIAKVGNGNIELLTPFAPVRVEEKYLDFKFAQGAVEQGKEVPYVVTVETRKDFEGEAEVKLVGLPANATAEPLKVTKDTSELIFTIKAAENTPPGVTKNLLCQVLVPEAGTHILHNLGSGVLRVDPPPPAPKTEEPKKEKPAVAEAKPQPKPLSRLEQLRQQQAQRDGAEQGGEE